MRIVRGSAEEWDCLWPGIIPQFSLNKQINEVGIYEKQEIKTK